MHSLRRMKALNRVLSPVLVGLIAIYSLAPFFWILVTSLKPPGTEFRLPVEYWPARPTLESYRTVLGEFNFAVALRNSFIVASAVAVLVLLIGSLSAYAIARLRFRFKLESLVLVLVGGTIPWVVTIAPIFRVIRDLGLLQSLPGIILPHVAYFMPLSVWLLTSYFVQLPFDLEDAAKTDGYAPFQVFWRVIMPLSSPGLFSTGVFVFLGSWGEFMVALTIGMGLPGAQTVPVAVLGFSQQFRLQWSWVSAGIVLSLIPVVAIVMIFQRWVIRGLTAGAVKY
ncbi:MAG: carbohydrate ABC transporter permease [Anaerolineae bacterium]|nr:carbohydrate ABC transporter permease [Anaerolineae bacterium]